LSSLIEITLIHTIPTLQNHIIEQLHQSKAKLVHSHSTQASLQPNVLNALSIQSFFSTAAIPLR
jgi:hypothetical protein